MAREKAVMRSRICLKETGSLFRDELSLARPSASLRDRALCVRLRYATSRRTEPALRFRPMRVTIPRAGLQTPPFTHCGCAAALDAQG